MRNSLASLRNFLASLGCRVPPLLYVGSPLSFSSFYIFVYAASFCQLSCVLSLAREDIPTEVW